MGKPCPVKSTSTQLLATKARRRSVTFPDARRGDVGERTPFDFPLPSVVGLIHREMSMSWMASDPRSGRAAVSRRARHAARPSLETVERRELLAAGPFGMNVEIDPYPSLVNWLQYQGRWANAPGQSNTITYDSV